MVPSKDNFLGEYNQNGTWNGIVGQLQRKVIIINTCTSNYIKYYN